MLRDTKLAFSQQVALARLASLLASTWLKVCVSDVRVSRDSHGVIPKHIASIVVALVPMYGERWLA